MIKPLAIINMPREDRLCNVESMIIATLHGAWGTSGPPQND